MVNKRMKTKAKPNTILEKKLEELESSLEIFGLRGGDDLNKYREIQHRFIFIKTLLTAEISSVSADEEEEVLKLACMAKNLTELEEAFDKQLTGPITEPDMRVLESRSNADETGSVFSLVEPLPEGFQNASMDKMVEDVAAGRETDEIKKNRFRSLVRFIIVGLIACMVSYFGCLCDLMNEDTNNFLTPT